VERQHFADASVFAERKEQVFCVKAVIHPDVRRGGDDRIHRVDHAHAGRVFQTDPRNLCFQVFGHIKAFGNQQDNVLKAKLLVMAQRRVHFGFIFSKNESDRPFG
jgi:hypothetical protein